MSHGNGAFKAPKHLRAATRRWVEGIDRDYQLESHHHRLLVLAGESWDRCVAAREALEKHGLVYNGKFGPKPRPEVAIEHNCKIVFARMLREIGLDVNDPDESRPPRVGGRY